MDNDDAWRQLRLSLERPYKDDNSEPIPVLLDITQNGEPLYEPKESPTKKLSENLRRIFLERGPDFFDKRGESTSKTASSPSEDGDEPKDAAAALQDEDSIMKAMTAQDLFKMRSEILPQLLYVYLITYLTLLKSASIALGEISLARDLLNNLLCSTPANFSTAPRSTSDLSATIVSKPPPITSVAAFNAQLTIGSKDETLRKAADIFKSAAESTERSRCKREKYWVNALKIRRGNWGLIPAPLPYGSATGKGADKTAKDILVSYGLEDSSGHFRQRAVGHLSRGDASTSEDLIFLNRNIGRLRISMSANVAGRSLKGHSTLTFSTNEGNGVETVLRQAQQEIVEQEIFSLLVHEAGNLPTASARVSERLVAIEAVQGMELKFELVDPDSPFEGSEDAFFENCCHLIYWSLQALLSRRHAFLKQKRLGTTVGSSSMLSEPSAAPSVLQPITDLLQYQFFCERIEFEMRCVVDAISVSGIHCTLWLDRIGDAGDKLLDVFDSSNEIVINGEAVLRIDSRHSVRLTFSSPSTLIAHLPQATLPITSIPQLSQLLSDEVERCLLTRICELGNQLCEQIGGTWFIDLNRCIGRWEGCILNVRILHSKEAPLDCHIFKLDRKMNGHGTIIRYSERRRKALPLLSWVEDIIKTASS